MQAQSLGAVLSMFPSSIPFFFGHTWWANWYPAHGSSLDMMLQLIVNSSILINHLCESLNCSAE